MTHQITPEPEPPKAPDSATHEEPPSSSALTSIWHLIYPGTEWHYPAEVARHLREAWNEREQRYIKVRSELATLRTEMKQREAKIRVDQALLEELTAEIRNLQGQISNQPKLVWSEAGVPPSNVLLLVRGWSNNERARPGQTQQYWYGVMCYRHDDDGEPGWYMASTTKEALDDGIEEWRGYPPRQWMVVAE